MPKRPTRYDLRCPRGPLHQQYSNSFTDAPSPGLGSNTCHSPAAFVRHTAAESSELHSFLALMLPEPSRNGSLSPPSALHAVMTLLNSQSFIQTIGGRRAFSFIHTGEDGMSLRNYLYLCLRRKYYGNLHNSLGIWPYVHPDNFWPELKFISCRDEKQQLQRHTQQLTLTVQSRKQRKLYQLKTAEGI